MKRFVEVAPRHTSQTCNSCGTVNSASRQEKVFLCVACGFTLDVDLNAALNILRKSLAVGIPCPASTIFAGSCWSGPPGRGSNSPVPGLTAAMTRPISSKRMGP